MSNLLREALGSRPYSGPPDPSSAARTPLFAATTASLLIAAMGYVDYATGIELRVYPLYFIPVSLAAWLGGPALAVAAACGASLIWGWANHLGGLRYSHSSYLIGNIATQFVAFIFIGLLIAVLRRRSDAEHWAARHDRLTELTNAQGFYEALEREVQRARRHSRTFALAYLDLDDFKAVNDRAGHRAGDDVLRSAARVLREGTRVSDTLARLGGDEFALILPETDAEGAHLLLQRLRINLQEAMQTAGFSVTASIGAVIVTSTSSDADELIAAADLQMYAAKQEGKNHVRMGVVPLGKQPTFVARERTAIRRNDPAHLPPSGNQN